MSAKSFFTGCFEMLLCQVLASYTGNFKSFFYFVHAVFDFASFDILLSYLPREIILMLVFRTAFLIVCSLFF